ncbi:MAG: cupredoxin domain-containing protein [Gallionella sp.]|nr:cupredoxin domain-containing protein [Gallionella sp.]
MLDRIFFACFAAGIFFISVSAFAADPLMLSIRGSRFEPELLAVPAGVKLKLVIRNPGNLPVEFESTDLSREVIVRGQGETEIYIGPLDPGNYRFFNDFNRDMQGTIVAKPASNKEN